METFVRFSKNKLLPLLFGIILAFGLLELGLRVVGYSHPNFYHPANDVGWTNNPGASGYFDREGFSWVEINQEGFRDRNHSFEKPEDTLRIAVLADSFGEAFQVPLKQSFWKVMESQLNTCPHTNKRVSVMNFSVSGYGTIQQLLVLRHRVWKYNPDIILLAIYPDNDIRNNSKQLEPTQQRHFTTWDTRVILVPENGAPPSRSFDAQKPYTHVKSPLALESTAPSQPASPGMLKQTDYWLRKHLRIVQFFKEIQEHWIRFQRQDMPDAHEKDEDNPLRRESGGTLAVYHPPETEDWREAWTITETLIEQINRETRAAAAQLWLTPVTAPIQVNPDSSVREAFKDTIGMDHLLYPQNRIFQLADAKEIPVIPLVRPMRKHAVENNTCLHGFDNAHACRGHWNQTGHRLAGSIMARSMCESFAESPPGDGRP